ncbi:hypothetical protein JL720_8076 [Aureococcus anophagefferens]|nr:hypothetical protein JL720_8076 [Aureococcus anophagefferens]
MKLALAAAAALTAPSGAMSAYSVELDGSGTTNPSKFYWEIMSLFEARAKPGVKMTYRAVGSSTGQYEFMGEDQGFAAFNDFGSATCRFDRELRQAQGRGRRALHIPFNLGAMSFFHNPIVVYHRTYGSSTTKGITQYLAAACPDKWTQVGSTIDWPSSTFAVGSGEMSSMISSTPYAIGYIDSGHGHDDGLSEIELKNLDGTYQSSTESIARGGVQAAAEEALALGVMPSDPAADFSQTATGAKGPLLKAFVEYVLSDDGQALLGDYNFEQAPQQVRDVGRKALEAMALAPGHEEWTFESATNKGAGQEDYVISAKRRSHYEYALGEIESEMASYASLKALEATVAALAADVAASSAVGEHVHVTALDEIFPDDGDDEDKQDEEIELALAVATAGLVFASSMVRQSTAETLFLGAMMCVAFVSLAALSITLGLGGESLGSPRRSMATLEAASLELYREVMAPYDLELADHDHMALRGAGVEHALVVEDKGAPGPAPRAQVRARRAVLQQGPGDRAQPNLEIPNEVAGLKKRGLHPIDAETWAAFRSKRVAAARAALPDRAPPPPPAAESPPRRVAVDYPHSTFHFSPHNYFALESLLAAHGPGTAVEATIVAPNMGTRFRYSNANALTQFERYVKLGFDVTTRIVNSETQLYRACPGVHAERGSYPGQKWWTAHRRTMAPKYVDFMKGFMRDDGDVVPPSSLTFFLRMQSLWRSGGVFVDLSLYFTAPLDPRARGFAVGPSECGPDTDFYHGNAPPPMVLAFPEPFDAAAACALKALDACGADVACADDLAYRPTALLERCFDGAPNGLDGAVESCGLRGSHYKEPGGYINAVYYRQPLSKRASRYAYFKNDEGLDGDINWDKATQDTLATYDRCYAKAMDLLRQNRTRAATAGIDSYYGLACQKMFLRRKDPYGLIRKSLYVYQVIHYMQVYGAHSVTAAIAPVHVTPITPKPEHFWSQAGYTTLRDWFARNDRLYAALGTTEAALGWERKVHRDFRAPS